MKRALLALPLLLVLAACGAKQTVPTVAWTPDPAPAPEQAAQACKAAQLRAGTPVFTSAAGTILGRVALQNTGAPCALGEGLAVRLEPALVLQTTPPSPQRPTAAATAWLGSLGSNRGADVALQWTNWCVKGKRPERLRIVLPDKGGSLTLDAPKRLPKCYEISAPTTVSATVSPLLEHKETSLKSALDARILPPGDDSEAKLQARAGGVLRYRVEFTNATEQTLRVPAACPVYAQLLVGGQPDVHKLACAALDLLKSGHKLVYEMQLKVPAVTQPGSHVLNWVLSPFVVQSPDLSAPVTITAG